MLLLILDLPSPQLTQGVAGLDENVLPEQYVQLDAPARLYDPTAHALHLTLPQVLVYVPAAQERHAVEIELSL